MSELDELYQNVILDHNRSPRNYRVVDGANRHAEGNNPLCGDRIGVWLRLDGDVIADVGFQGNGCAISKASASLMTTVVKGRTVREAEELFGRFHELVTGEAGAAREGLGKLGVFRGVAAFPIRVKCASLPWHALKAALDGPETVVTTEGGAR